MDKEVLLILALGIFVGFYVQTVIGFAGALIALPVLLLAMELPDAIAYISIFYLFSSFFLIRKEWKNIDKGIILTLAFTSVIGVILGTLLLMVARPLILKKGLGLFILLYVIYNVIGKRKIKLNKVGVTIFGVMAGFFSGVFSTGGPLYVMCVENTVKEIKTIRATMIGVLGIVTIVRVPALTFSGILNTSHIKMTLMVLPIFFLAQYMGRLSFNKISENIFKKSLLALLSISGILLLLK